MRILVMTNLYPNPFQPHRAAFNRQRIHVLALKHPVRVIAPIAWTDELRARSRGAAPLPPGRHVELNGVPVVHPRFIFPPRLLRSLHGHCYQASVARTFRRAVAEFQPDIVFAPWGYPDGWAAVRLGHAAGLPVVTQVHGSDVLLLDQYPARRRKTVEGLQNADGVISVSQDIANKMTALGVDESRILVNYDGVDLSIFCPGSKAEARAKVGLSDGPPVVLFAGNLTPVKAIDVLLKAAQVLVREGSAIRLVLIGEGPLRPELERQAKDLGIADQVRFVGSLPWVELPDWYRSADVFCLPSHSEGVPTVLLEASACGTPWVASQVGGIPEIADIGISQLVAPNRPEALADALRTTLTEPVRAKAPGPRDRRDSIDEVAAFLDLTLSRYRCQRGKAPAISTSAYSDSTMKTQQHA
jgi:glycosyltransferase involved in cell wall biosynthesis